MSKNSVVLIGRLTKDPEVKQTSGGKAVLNMTLAVDRDYSANEKQQGADFIPVIVWGTKASACGSYLHKGSLVSIGGKLQTRSYTDKDGKKVFTMEVVASSVDFLESKKTGQNQQMQQPLQPQNFAPQYPQQAVPYPQNGYGQPQPYQAPQGYGQSQYVNFGEGQKL